MSDREYVYRRTPMRFEVVGRAFAGGSPFVQLKPIADSRGAIDVPWEDFTRDYSEEEPVPPWRPTEVAEAEPAGLDDEAAAEQAWDEAKAETGFGHLVPWRGLIDESSRINLAFARRFRDLTSPKTEPKPHATPAAEIDAEAMARAAWQVACRSQSLSNEWDDLSPDGRYRYIAFARFIIDAVTDLQPPAAVESREEIFIPLRYFKPLSDGSYSITPDEWDAARARWIADGRPAS